MKILLFGKNGQLGFELQRSLAPFGDLYAIDRDDFDLSFGVGLPDLIHDIAPSVIVNAAGYNDVDKAEDEAELAMDINCHAPAMMAEAAKESSALLVHFSSDCVFGGEKIDAYYDEDDAPNPLSAYGRSKLAGEQAIANSGANYLIYRTAWLLGAHGNNFTKHIIEQACEKDSLSVVNDRFGAPTTTALVADVTAHAIRQIVQYCDGDAMGLYHLVANGETSLYEYAKYILEKAAEMGKSLAMTANEIHAISSAEYPSAAQRPLHSRLNNKKLCDILDLALPQWQSGVDHVLQQIL